MGQSCGANDDTICRKRTPNLPIHESIIQRSAQKQRRWTIVNTLLCRRGRLLKLFFAQLFLSISSVFYGAVSEMCEECNTCKDRTGRLVVAGQSNPLFVASVMKTHTPLTGDPAQEKDLLQRYQERIGKALTTKLCDKVLYLCRILDNS